MISFSIQAQREDEFAYRLQRLRDLVRKGLVDPELGTLSKQAQLLSEHCMRLTPPKSVGQGKRRVKFDLNKIFHPVAVSDLNSKGLRKIVRIGDAQAWDAFARRVQRGPFAQTTAVEPSRDLHRANRDRRGRARKTKFVTLYPQQSTLRDMIRAKQEKVGWARAGWLRGYLALGGTRAPDWVMRHAPGSGTFTDGRTLPDNPMVAVYNTTDWARYHDEARRVVSDAMRARARAMQSYFEATMRLAAEGKQTSFQMQQAAIADQFGAAA